MKGLTARLLLDLGGIEQRGNDRGRPNSHCNSGLHQLRSTLLAGPVVIVIRIAHRAFSMAFDVALEVI
jgi:hypothetical protein